MSQRGGKLDDIRKRIDAMDGEIHELLMRRGTLIAELQLAKGVGGPSGTSAMRPAREAQMMRALAERHSGDFPLIAAERIWREIIASFTQLQAPFRVMLTGDDEANLRELGRFYFGVATPLETAADAEQVLEAVALNEDVAGVVVGDIKDSDWWARLAAASDHPARIVARLPFFSDSNSSAPWSKTAYVVSRAAFEQSGADRTLIVARSEEALGDDLTRVFKTALTGHRVTVLASANLNQERFTLFDVDGYVAPGSVKATDWITMRWIGGYPTPYSTSKV